MVPTNDDDDVNFIGKVEEKALKTHLMVKIGKIL